MRTSGSELPWARIDSGGTPPGRKSASNRRLSALFLSSFPGCRPIRTRPWGPAPPPASLLKKGCYVPVGRCPTADRAGRREDRKLYICFPLAPSQLKYQLSNSSKASAYSRVVGAPESTGKYTANSNKHPAAKAASSSVAPWHSNPPGKVSRRAKGPFSYSRENTPHSATTRKGTAVK